MPSEIHPEDLLERAAHGALTATEHEQLEAHLRRCVACRLERRARLDFGREADALDALGASADVQPLLARVLAAQPMPDAAQLPPGATTRAMVPARLSRALPTRRLLPLLAASLLVSVAAWAAAIGFTRTVAPAVVPLPALAGTMRPPGARDAETASAPRASADTAPPSVAQGTVPSLLGEPDRRGPTLPSASAGSSAHDGQRMSMVGHAPRPVDTATVGASFDEANTARRAGDHGRAGRLYRELIARYPDSAEARTAQVALGRMLLDDGDASSAIGCFDRTVHAGGPLAEDAMLGRALALHRMGRPADEASAWGALLHTYPQSAHAARARQRLLELGAP